MKVLPPPLTLPSITVGGPTCPITMPTNEEPIWQMIPYLCWQTGRPYQRLALCLALL